MAKATANCTCRKCGANFTKTNTLQNRKDANAWEAWALQHYDLCPDCYIQKKREEDKLKGLIGELILNYDVAAANPISGNGFVMIAGGDAYGHRDELKACGYQWIYPETATDIYTPSKYYDRKAWCKSGPEPQALINEFEILGGKVIQEPDKTDIKNFLEYREELKKEQLK